MCHCEHKHDKAKCELCNQEMCEQCYVECDFCLTPLCRDCLALNAMKCPYCEGLNLFIDYNQAILILDNDYIDYEINVKNPAYFIRKTEDRPYINIKGIGLFKVMYRNFVANENKGLDCYVRAERVKALE